MKHAPIRVALPLLFSRGIAGAVLLAAVGVICPPSGGSEESVGAQGSPLAAAVPLPTDPEIVTGTLSNGLTYFVRSKESTGHALQLMLAVRAGSLVEEEDEQGFAHFIEHLALDGSQRFNGIAPVEFIQSLGGSLGSDVNAQTHPADTVYQMLLPNVDRQRLVDGLEVLAGWAGGEVRASTGAVERQREIVLAELRYRERPAEGFSGAVQRWLKSGSRYAQRSPWGREALLRAASPNRLEAFYRRWYRPPQLAVVATGQYDARELRQLIEWKFGRLPAGGEAQAAPRFDVAVNPGEEVSLLNASDVGHQGGSEVLVKQLLPLANVGTETGYLDYLVDRCIAALLDARLKRRAYQEGSPLDRVACRVDQDYAMRVQSLSCTSSPRAGWMQDAAEILLTEFARLDQHSVHRSELLAVKAALLSAISADADSRRTGSLRGGAERMAFHFLHGEPLLSTDQEQELSQRLLGKLDPEGVRQRFSDWLRRSRRLVMAVRASNDASLLTEQKLTELVKSTKQRPLDPAPLPKPTPPLMAVLPEPGKILRSERKDALNLRVWNLENGARVVWKSSGVVSGKLALRGVSPGGISRSDHPSSLSVLAANTLIAAGGAGQYDARTLSRLLNGTTTRVTTTLDENSEGIDASASGADVEAMFQLIHLYLTQPRPDATALEAYRKRLRQLKSPEEEFRAAIDLALKGGPRRSWLDEANAIDLHEALAFYRDRFGNVGDFTFVMVGDIDEARLERLVQRYLASLPGSPRDDTPRVRAPARPEGIRHVRLQGRPGRDSEVVTEFRGVADAAPEAKLDLEALERYLRLRLLAELRERLNAVYNVRVEKGWSGSEYFLRIGYTCRLEDVERLQRATLAVVNELRASGGRSDLVEVLEVQWGEHLQRALKRPEFWLDELASAYLKESDPGQILELPKWTARIDREHLRSAARRYLRQDQYVDAVWAAAR
jgi:zinc protease